MKTKLFPFIFAMLVALVLSACGNDDAILAEPKVGDMYAAELTHFTSFEDDKGKPVDKGFGLLRVTDVQADTIDVITSAWYRPAKRGVASELNKYQAANQWDHSDVITIQRADLIGLRKDGKIFGVKRKNKEEGKEE